MRSFRIILWGAWYGSHNVGDQALLLSIVDMLGEKLESVEFIVFTNDRSHVLDYTGRESNYRIRAFQNKSQFHRLVQSLRIADLFIFGGGAPFFEKPYQLLIMTTLVSLARVFRTPYMTWSVSSQKVQNKIAKLIFKWVINGASAVTYRDLQTCSLFKSSGVFRPMEQVPDPVYTMKIERSGAVDRLLQQAGLLDQKRPLAALTPRVLRGKDGEAETHYNVKTPEEYNQEIDCFAAAVDWLWQNGYQPIFVPMNTISPDDDRLAAYSVMERAHYGTKTLIIDKEIRPRLAPAIYERCQIAFVARVHGSISAMLGNCPVMMYAFAPKHAGIMETMDLNRYILNEKDANPDTTGEMLADLHENLQKTKIAMLQKLGELQNNAQRSANICVEIINKA